MRLLILRLVIITILLNGCASSPRNADQAGITEERPFNRFLQKVADDHRQHYQLETLRDLAPPLLFAGTLANSNIDQQFRQAWQEELRSNATDEVAQVFRFVGDLGHFQLSVPIYSFAMIATGYSGREGFDSRAATWMERSFRANLLGAPQAVLLANVLGAGRPDEGGSGWTLLDDNNAVSGHSFFGSVPLLTAARMSESASWRYSLYALSTLPALSRVNDDRHYLSQAVLGWSVAWLATRTVADESSSSVSITPVLLPDGAYVALFVTF